MAAGDTEAYAASYSEDAVIQGPNAPALRGRAEIEAWHRTLPAFASIEWPDAQVRGSGDLAYATAGYVQAFAGARPDRGKQLAVYRRQDDGAWKIVAVSFSSDLPAPGADTR